MATSNEYTDNYLKPLVSESVEDRATEDVTNINTFTDPWKTKLIVIRAYLIVCQENCKAADDIFTVKAKAYEGEWKTMLKLATDAANALLPAATQLSSMSIPILRA